MYRDIAIRLVCIDASYRDTINRDISSDGYTVPSLSHAHILSGLSFHHPETFLNILWKKFEVVKKK